MSFAGFVPLGLLALVASVTLLTCGDDGQSSSFEPTPFPVCMRTVPALTTELLTDTAFKAADDDLSTAGGLAEAGDVDGAEAAFFGPHTLTHNIDGPLRQADEALAIRLCNETLIMEDELVGNRDPSVVAEQARKIRDALSAAAVVLGMEPQ